MKRLSVVAVVLVVAVVVALTIGAQLASATPGENGEVKFRGTVTSDEQCDVFPVCYEECFCPVNLTEVLDDPLGLLEGVSSVEVCYGHSAMGLEAGETVEVYGYYWMGQCPMQYCTRVIVEGDPYYIVRLPVATPTPGVSVGGSALPTDKSGLLRPWIVGGGALMVVGAVWLALWHGRRRAGVTLDR